MPLIRKLLNLYSKRTTNNFVGCNHTYCYRDLHCTKCGELYKGKYEPEFTPHFMIDGKLVPEEAQKACS